jgi:hypothetical protein
MDCGVRERGQACKLQFAERTSGCFLEENLRELKLLMSGPGSETLQRRSVNTVDGVLPLIT